MPTRSFPQRAITPGTAETSCKTCLMKDCSLLTKTPKNMSSKALQREFIPIPQSFGDWNGRQWSSWMLPPLATQKALLFLPLCYAPDGLVYYQLLGTGDGDRGGSVAPIYMEGDGIAKFDKMYDLLKEHNPRILKTGEMLWTGTGWAPRTTMWARTRIYLHRSNISDSKTTEKAITPVISKQDIMRTMRAKS